MSKLHRVDEREAEEPLLGGDGRDDDAAWAKPPRRSRLRRVAVVAGALVAALVLALLLVKSQMHRIATNAIATTAMTIQRMELTNPQRDALTLTVELDVESSSMFPATIGATNFTISYGGAAVGVFESPAMAVAHGHNRETFRETSLRIVNLTAWNSFAGDLMMSQRLEYEIQGVIDLSVSLLGGLIHLRASDVALKKVISSEGMDGLRRLDITSILMDKSTQSQVVASIKTCLFNPSQVSIRPVGRICMEGHYPTPGAASHVAHLMTSGDVSINVTRDDVSHPYCLGLSSKDRNMSRGYNLLELEGEILRANPTTINSFISKYLSNVPAPMTVVACKPRATTIDIFNGAMEGLRIPAVVPPRKDPLVGRLFFESINLDAPEKEHENEFIGLKTDVTVEASSPLGPLSSLQLESIDMNVAMYATLDWEDGDVLLGTLRTRKVDIIAGRLVEVSNVSVRCDAAMDLEMEGKPFGAFVRKSAKNPAVRLRLSGKIDVVARGALGLLKLTGLPMDVVAKLKGMDNFQRVTIEEFSLPGKPVGPSGEALTTKILLWNPSLFAVSIGNVQLTMNLADSSDHLGELSGLMNLNAGRNELHLSGKIQPKEDSSGSVSQGVALFFSKYLRGEASRVEVTISDVEYSRCLWITEALIGLKISTDFPGVKAGFQLITGIEMRELDVRMEVAESAVTSNTVMRVRTDLTALLKMPASIAIPLNISNVSVALTLQDFQRRSMGELKSKREACEYKQFPSGFFRLNMTDFYPVTFPTVEAAVVMATFVADLLTKSGNVTMRIASTSSDGAFPDVDTRMGMLPLARIPISGAPQLPGMNSFRQPPVKVLSVDIIEGTDAQMTMQMSFEIANPSVVRTELGKLVLGVLSSGAKMGDATIESFELECCGKKSVLHGTFIFDPSPDDADITARFLSNFVSGYFTNRKPQEITIAGSRQSTPLDILQPALASLRIPSSLPTLPELFPESPTLVTSSMLYMPSILHLNKMPTSLRLRNPFSENITVVSVDLLLYPCETQRNVNGSLVCDSYYKDPLARFAPEQFSPIFIPSKSKGCFSCCQGTQCETKLPLCPRASVGTCMAATVEGFISAEAIAAIFRTATSGLLMSVNGTIGATIGAYQTHLFYKQEGLLVTLAK